MDIIDAYEELDYALIKLKKAEKIKRSGDYTMTLSKELEQQVTSKNLDKNLIEFYKEISDGFFMKWHSVADSSVGGNMHFMEMAHVLGDHHGTFFDDDDIRENDLIEHYKPFDLITDSFSCGFLITPDYVSKSIYCVKQGDSETYDLDIDFEGYMEMAYEARIFNYWPQVLLDIQSGETSAETDSFKTHMPQLFEDFSWDAFVQKYESLRLSK